MNCPICGGTLRKRFADANWICLNAVQNQSHKNQEPEIITPKDFEAEYRKKLDAWVLTWPLTKLKDRHIFHGKAPDWVNNVNFRKIRDEIVKYINSPAGGGFWVLTSEPEKERKPKNPNRKPRRKRCRECQELIPHDEEYSIPLFRNHDPKNGIYKRIEPLCHNCSQKIRRDE